MSARLLVATTRAVRDVKAVSLPGSGLWLMPLYNDDIVATEIQQKIAQQAQAGVTQ